MITAPDPQFPGETYFAPAAWLVAFMLGLLVVAAGLPLMKVFPQESYAVQPGYGAPVFALEMARSVADVDAVLGPPGDPFRAQRVAEMDRGNLLDFGFLAAYTAFNAAFFAAVYRSTGKRRWLLVVALAISAGLAVAGENLLLFRITSGTQLAEALRLLPYAAWAKFFAIMVCILLAARYLQRSRNKLWYLLGWVAIAGAASVAVAFYNPSEYGLYVQHGISAGWGIMLAYALVRAVRSSRLLREAAS